MKKVNVKFSIDLVSSLYWLLNFKPHMKSLLFIVFFALTICKVSAQSDSGKIQSVGVTDTTNAAKIVVIRSTGHVASLVNLRVLVDEAPYCKVKNNRYSVFYVQLGTHMFYATSWDKPAAKDKFALSLPTEAGKTYYLSMRIKTRFASTEFFLEEITLNSAGPLMEKYKKDDCE